MVSKAVVKKIIDENYAEVEVMRKSACGDNCASCSGCDKPSYKAVSIAKNTINAKEGDVVNVRSSAGYVLKGAAYIYVLPVLIFFLAYMGSKAINLSEMVASVVALVGFCVGIYIAGLYSKKISKDQDTKLEIF